jgi:hypothetical protein
MKSDIEITELIGNYLMNRLSESERKRVENLIKTDPLYGDNYDFQKKLKAAVTEKEMRKKLKIIEDKIVSRNKG